MASRTDTVTQPGLDTPEPREPWFAQDADRVVAAMETDAERGLSRREAAARLSRYGPNEITGEKPPSVWAVALQQLRDPMNIMLVAVVVVSFVIGQVSTGDHRGAADPAERRARLAPGAEGAGEHRRAVEACRCRRRRCVRDGAVALVPAVERRARRHRRRSRRATSSRPTGGSSARRRWRRRRRR